mgnify:CR=1 FL=1
MIKAYSQSAATLNLLRSFATGGYAAMQRVSQWNLDFTTQSDQGYRYIKYALFDCLGIYVLHYRVNYWLSIIVLKLLA